MTELDLHLCLMHFITGSIFLQLQQRDEEYTELCQEKKLSLCNSFGGSPRTDMCIHCFSLSHLLLLHMLILTSDTEWPRELNVVHIKRNKSNIHMHLNTRSPTSLKSKSIFWPPVFLFLRYLIRSKFQELCHSILQSFVTYRMLFCYSF